MPFEPQYPPRLNISTQRGGASPHCPLGGGGGERLGGGVSPYCPLGGGGNWGVECHLIVPWGGGDWGVECYLIVPWGGNLGLSALF